MKERTGNDYGFDHEIVAGCVILGCVNHGFSIASPFYDPEEVVRLANKDGRKKVKERAKEYCLQIKEKFGEFYGELGAPIDGIMDKL